MVMEGSGVWVRESKEHQACAFHAFNSTLGLLMAALTFAKGGHQVL